MHLMSHRFASHCCEALFIRSAPVVTEELVAPASKMEGSKAVTNSDDIYVSMENLFLHTIAELEGNVGFLMTDRFASHALRVLLVVLSGEPLDNAKTKSLLQSKKKEGITVNGIGKPDDESKEKNRAVPQSFATALEKLIAESIVGLDSEQLRALATHPNANPTLQLLLRLELTHLGKQRAKDETSIIRTLLPDDPITADSGSASFINGLVYDPIGSHLVETIVYCAPAKLFRSLYREMFRERLTSYARNEIAGFVACRILERLGKDDLLEAHEMLSPHITSLLQRNRTNIVQTLIERCVIREIDTKGIAVQVNATWDGPQGFEIKKLLKVDQGLDSRNEKAKDSARGSEESATDPSFERSNQPVKAHFNLLAQAMLLVPGSLSALVIDSLIELDGNSMISIAHDSIVSRTLQAALISKNSSIITTRKLVQHFYGHIGAMAVDTAASHVVDCIWEGTHGLAFIRERIAEELAENEAQLRDSGPGRAVWKNWKMDMYKRRRSEWITQSKIKASNDGFQSFTEIDSSLTSKGQGKTPLQLAQERHMKQKTGKSMKSKGKKEGKQTATGANASAPPAPASTAKASS